MVISHLFSNLHWKVLLFLFCQLTALLQDKEEHYIILLSSPPLLSPPEECLAGEAAVTSVVNMFDRGVSTDPTRDLASLPSHWHWAHLSFLDLPKTGGLRRSLGWGGIPWGCDDPSWTWAGQFSCSPPESWRVLVYTSLWSCWYYYLPNKLVWFLKLEMSKSKSSGVISCPALPGLSSSSLDHSVIWTWCQHSSTCPLLTSLMSSGDTGGSLCSFQYKLLDIGRWRHLVAIY